MTGMRCQRRKTLEYACCGSGLLWDGLWLRVLAMCVLAGGWQGPANAQDAAQPPAVAKSATPAKSARPARVTAAPTVLDSPQGAVDAAAKLIDAGKTDPAIETLTTAIAGGKLEPALLARALYLRGKAYRIATKPALAISDLTSALWIKTGLNTADRADATLQRSGAYTEAGLDEQGRQLPKGTAPKPVAVAAVEPPAAVVVVEPVRAAPVARPVVAPKTQTIATAALAVPASAFRSRVALVRTQAEAEAVVAKLRAGYASVLGGQAANIGPVSFGNMGSFFQVQVGSFASAVEAKALCAKLRGSGLDCVAVNQ